MQTQHDLFHVLGVTTESRVKFLHSKGISLCPGACSLLLTVQMWSF